MSFAIISGRNNGYPCIPELDELISAERKPPYSDFMMIAAGNSYPVIKSWRLKKVRRIVQFLIRTLFSDAFQI